MPAEYKCNCRVLRYAPDPVKGEFVNIGLVFREDRGSETAPDLGSLHGRLAASAVRGSWV